MLFLVVWMFSGCEMMYLVRDTVQDNYLLHKIQGQKLYNPGFPEMETFEDVADYVKSVLTYEKYSEILDPEEALEKGVGNCNTYAILFMDVAHFTLSVDFGFAGADCAGSDQRAIGEGGFPNHAAIILNNQLYSAYRGTPITDYKAGYSYDFNEVFINL